MARLNLSLLGPVTCGLDGNLVQFKTKLAQALLVYLAMEAQQAHSRESLAALLWPEQPAHTARHNLRQTLLYLRQGLGAATADPYLRITHQTLQFDATADHHLDATRFSAHLEATQRHPHANLATCAACLARLAQAAALYRGDFLAHFFLDNNQPFEEWALVQREALRSQALEALYLLADCHAEQGDLAAAAGFARRQVELDGLREEAYRQWMRAAALLGRRSEALGAYEAVRRRLDQELGVAPAAETTALYDLIVDGRLPAASPAAAAARPPNLPRALTPFVGREADLAEISRRLDDAHCALLTLFGPGGVGKTRLALEVARQRSAAYRDGVAFVPLESLAAPDHLATAIGSAVGLDFRGEAEPQQQLLAHLRGQQRLLVLDNFESLLAEAPTPALLLDLLHGAPGVQLLVTSREVLNLRAEWLFEVAGLPYPPADAAGEPARVPGSLPDRYAAVRLFTQHAHRLRHDFAPGPEDLALISRLCRLVAGLPLAIELAAALTRAQTCAAIAAAVERNLDNLATTQSDVPARQRSLHALFEYSWDLLEARARGVLARLAVFRGGLTVEAAQPVAGASETDLKRLAEKSFLRRRADGRYEMHAVLRQYAAQKLASVDAAAASARHGAYYSRWVQGHAQDLSGEATAEAAAAIQSELDNVRAAWEWAVAQGDLPALARSLAGLARFYVLKSLTREGEAALGAAIAAVRLRMASEASREVWVSLFEEPEAPVPAEAVLAALLVMHGRLLARLARGEAAAAAFAEGIELASAHDGQRIQALGYTYWGLLDVVQANYPAASAKAERALDLAQAAGWTKVQADALRLMGNIAGYQGDLLTSRRHYERCLPLGEAVGDRRGTSATLSNLGSLCLEQGDWPAAAGYFEQALALHHELGDQASLGQTLVNLGRLAEARGSFGRAAELHAQALEITRAIGDRQHEPDAHLHLGLTALGQRQHETARSQLDTALELYRALGDRWGEAAALEGLGQLAEAQGAPAQALEALEAALVLRRAIFDRTGIASTLTALGQLAAGSGRQAEARAQLHEALETASANQATPLLLRALTAAATLLMAAGQGARAAELLTVVLHHPSTDSQTRDRAGRAWAEAVRLLPEAAAAAAQARGRLLEPAILAAELAGPAGGL
jgi:predicted ATPase/DNA-binding SARP family transcriptional activator